MGIREIKKLDEKVEESKKKANKLLREAKKQNKKVKIKRDGKEVEVDEKDLWREGLSLQEGEAWDHLNKEYPEVFEAFKKHNDLAEELIASFVKEFGFALTEMSQGKFIKAVEHIIDEHNNNN